MRLKISSGKGFTLIELLVAISVLAIIAVLGWRGLDSIVRTRATLNEDLEQTRGLQLTFAQLQNDCMYWVGANGLAASALPTFIAQNGRLILVRTVFIEQQPTQLQVVAYRLHDGVLTRQESPATRDGDELRQLWQTMSRAAPAASGAVILQTNIDAMTWRVWMNDGNGWRTPVAATERSPSAAPMTGAEVTLQLRGHARGVSKILLLGSA